VDNLKWTLGFLGLCFLAYAVLWLITVISNSRKYVHLKPSLDKLDDSKREHEERVKEDRAELERKNREHHKQISSDRAKLEDREKKWKGKVVNDKREILTISKQKSMGFPWLAEAYADYFALKDGDIEHYLINKKHPALKSAEAVKTMKQEKRALARDFKVIQYKLKYLESLFPWLSELIAEDEEDDIPVRIVAHDSRNESNDSVREYLTPEEYSSLSTVERNQRALDRYLRNRNKSKWALGRDYEMYVGYLYAQEGFSIEYKGIIDGFEDLGRDIIAIKPGKTCIIQCKRWAKYKEMHEKHIFQLFGTTMEYWIKHFRRAHMTNDFESFAKFLNDERLKPIFFTSTTLSERAQDMAKALDVEVRQNEPLGEFPRIKCNINKIDSVETKIYHLPMDQQYDRTIIGNRPGEFYAFTVKEAEDAGFRRAFRHRFKNDG